MFIQHIHCINVIFSLGHFSLYLSQYLKRSPFHCLGPVVQNLTKLLANVTLKFLSCNMANTLMFFAKKM